MYRLCITFIFLSFCFIAQSAFSAEEVEKNTADWQKSNRKFPWSQNININDFRADYPWIYDYYLYDTVSGKNAQWASDVNVSIQFPNNMGAEKGKTKNIFEFDDDEFKNLKLIQVESLLEQETSKFFSEIKAVFPYPIQWVSSNDPKAVYANFRIVIVNGNGPWKNDFKRSDEVRQSSTLGFPRIINFHGAIEKKVSNIKRFTLGNDNQVEGYFLSDANNHIVFSVCYIKNNHTELMTRNLTKECLLRGLGLPNLIKDASILSAWNILNTESSISLNDKDIEALRALYSGSF